MTIRIGTRIRLMDGNDSGTVTGKRGELYLIETDEGFPMELLESQFVAVDEDGDMALSSSKPSLSKKRSDNRNVSPVSSREPLVIDLHIDRIPGYTRAGAKDALAVQLDYFRSIMTDNLPHRGASLVFIHGDGDGTLRTAIRRELKEVYALRCTYGPARAELYGTGATIVRIR